MPAKMKAVSRSPHQPPRAQLQRETPQRQQSNQLPDLAGKQAYSSVLPPDGRGGPAMAEPANGELTSPAMALAAHAAWYNNLTGDDEDANALRPSKGIGAQVVYPMCRELRVPPKRSDMVPFKEWRDKSGRVGPPAPPPPRRARRGGPRRAPPNAAPPGAAMPWQAEPEPGPKNSDVPPPSWNANFSQEAPYVRLPRLENLAVASQAQLLQYKLPPNYLRASLADAWGTAIK
eukprot:TRINITY_DN26551_c0_g1_i5.p1 TRINITY_DN26551_c0_g1~~TRINITY_DN26551_c0_g1_i5.p1  ORF type:complete len:232 (-),score=37.99 TRINITY_DN26551_c0_g1_i5:29-724(-)